MTTIITALVALVIALALPYRWHRENKRARRVHDYWKMGNVPFVKKRLRVRCAFGKWHERRGK